ncbi:MAG: hypothetical protein KF862_09045 [Chitinophagaceae bacterium]|nr:hypothetical protein [Chitinophagaceae bacterium]
MSSKRSRPYFQRKKGATHPIRKKEDVRENPDNRIDQDFPGFPHAPAKEELIHPRTKQDKKTADADGKSG